MSENTGVRNGNAVLNHRQGKALLKLLKAGNLCKLLNIWHIGGKAYASNRFVCIRWDLKGVPELPDGAYIPLDMDGSCRFMDWLHGESKEPFPLYDAAYWHEPDEHHTGWRDMGNGRTMADLFKKDKTIKRFEHVAFEPEFLHLIDKIINPFRNQGVLRLSPTKKGLKTTKAHCVWHVGGQLDSVDAVIVPLRGN
ncbi:hypothetical protein [Bifidobacterium eulemuris]|uniref:Uncharacterized protein n=1 Tax=Bifidobacterium eulemuris TaxID=1765219 RepID=A0A261GB62_9BIFI|nr:hypothetical protein [Bifidobacterium eulemuris]OZG68216.1 hypothetical protein BEUL_1229 [Bifidobacterium eulemuris]QOL31727.1 hypothetical protein BE0216_04045 [Bifidobacterium eulemuris]